MLILQTLRRGEQHGYAISQAIRAGSREVFLVEAGSLYPALHRLEKRGWIRSEWRTSDNGQRAKYYKMTAAGKKQLSVEQTRWERLVGAVTALMAPAEGDS